MSHYTMPHVWPTVVHMLANAAERSPDKVALVCGDEQLTYQQYEACVSAFADELREVGLGPGERVALVMGNSLDVAIAIFAVQTAGAQVVPLNPAYTRSELSQVLENAQAKGIIYDESVAEALDPLLSGVTLRLRIGNGRGSQRLTRWAQQGNGRLSLPDPDWPSILQYTGGTTGLPKGVSLAHRAVAVNISQREALLPTQVEQERILAITPMFHSYAMAMGLYLAVYCRSTLVVMPRYRPDAVLATIASQGITLMLGSPTIFAGLMSYEGFAEADLSSLRLCSSGSSALSEETLRRWEAATGCVVCEGYGQTEAGPVLTYNPLIGVRKIGTVGVPVPLTEIQIVDVQDGQSVLPVGEMGEIRARGPQLMDGYFNRPEETADALRDGWLYTGDIGKLDHDGYLTICDRKKEMAIVSGFNVYPREVEEALFCHSDVREAAVVGVPDAYRGEILVAYVVADGTLTEEALLEFLSERLVKYKWPAKIHMVDTLPRTGVGKIDKKQLRAMSVAN